MPRHRPPSRALVVAGLVLLALGACSHEGASPEPEPPPPFALAAAEASRHLDQPAIALRFTRALAAEQDFEVCVRVEAEGLGRIAASPLLDPIGQALVVPWLEGGREYRIELCPELKAVDGERLGRAVTTRAVAGTPPPVLAFASAGSVLPAHADAGLPLRSFGVAAVDVDFFRVRPSHLPALLVAGPRPGTREAHELKELLPALELAYSGRFELPQTAEGPVVAELPVGRIDELRRGGVFLAAMRPAGSVEDRREVTLFFVTDLGLHLRAYPDAILVHAASLETGRPLSGTEVAVLDELGRTVQSARTDGDGLVLVPGRPRPGQLLHARRGSQQAWLSLSQTVLDLSDFPVQGIQPSPWSVALWSGRDLYRPGETLRFDVLLRDRDGRLPGPLPPLFARLVQPDGRAVLERRLEPGPLGHFALALASGPDWPTGRWQLELRSDPTSAAPLAALPVHVQEFLPERLSLRLGLTPPAPAPGEPLALELTAAFLHGAPAAGERWELKRRLRAAEAALADRPGWRFGDLTASWPPAEEGVGEGELDPTGAARVNLEAPTGLPAPTAIELTATVLPAGGRPVSRRIAATVWPRAEMVGLEPAFPLGEGAAPNVPAQFAVQRFAHDGRMLGGEVELRLLRRHEEWLWIIQPQGGFEPRRELREEEIERRTLRIGAERPEAVSFQLDWGEYLLVARDAAGAETRLTFRVGWGGASGELKPDRVKLTLDRTGYRPGDTVELTVDPPYAGPGLLLLERDRPLLTRRFEARAGTRLKIELSPEMVGEDSYLSVLVLRPARSGLGPARALGVIPLPVDRGERAATVRLALPERMVPGETATVAVEVPELAGEEAYVVLHAVDEGTLGISGYRIPDPLAALFARRRFLAELRDLYGRLIEDLEGRLARLRFGGDAPTDLPLPQVTRPRAEVLIPDLRFGPVRLDGGGRAEIALPAPAWDGRLRVTAVAVAAARFGRAEGELVVRGPLLAELTAPRSLAPGDAARVAVVLHNPEARAQTVTVRLGTEGALGVEPGSFELTLAGGERRVLEAMLTAGSMHGTGAVRLAAEAEGFRLTRRSEVAVRAVAPPTRRSVALRLPPGEPMSLPADLAEGLVPESVTARLTVADGPPFPFASAREELLRYPLGCVEQTIARAYGLVAGEGGAEAAAGLERALARVAGMQLAEGHFAMWPGESQARPLATALVAELLLDAGEAGFAVPEAMLERALAALERDLLRGEPGFWDAADPEGLRFAYHAHAAYALARAGRSNPATLRELAQRRGAASSPRALFLLAAALHLSGERQLAAEALAEALRFRPRPTVGDFGSPLADRLWLATLAARHRLGEPSALAWEAFRELQGRRRAGTGSLSTFELAALVRLGLAAPSRAGAIAVELRDGGESRRLAGRSPLVATIAPDVLGRLRLLAEGEEALEALVEVAGLPLAAPHAERSGIALARDYFRRDGTPLADGTLAEGELVIARLRLSAEQPMDDLLIEDLLPGGLELEIPDLSQSDPLPGVAIEGLPAGQRHHGFAPLREEFRDDRYLAVFDLPYEGAELTLFYVLRAVTPGEFAVPPARAEDMYRTWLRAVDEPRPARLRIVAAGGGR